MNTPENLKRIKRSSINDYINSLDTYSNIDTFISIVLATTILSTAQGVTKNKIDNIIQNDLEATLSILNNQLDTITNSKENDFTKNDSINIYFNWSKNNNGYERVVYQYTLKNINSSNIDDINKATSIEEILLHLGTPEIFTETSDNFNETQNNLEYSLIIDNNEEFIYQKEINEKVQEITKLQNYSDGAFNIIKLCILLYFLSKTLDNFSTFKEENDSHLALGKAIMLKSNMLALKKILETLKEYEKDEMISFLISSEYIKLGNNKVISIEYDELNKLIDEIIITINYNLNIIEMNTLEDDFKELPQIRVKK